MKTNIRLTQSISAFAVSLSLLLAACASPAAAPAAPQVTEPTVAADAAAAAATTAPAEAKPAGEKSKLRIGYQRGGNWTLLKAQGTLEKLFPDFEVTWTLFPSGPPLLEALNAGAIDIGSTGETPPIFAQAAGAPLVYIAAQTGNGAGSAIVVGKDSPAKTLADLKGKKVAFTKASSAHLLTIKALKKEGLTYADIEPAFLQPPEARAALEGGSVDAWVIWNPFLEAAIQELGANVIVKGQDVALTRSYQLASKSFVEQHPQQVVAIVEELRKAQEWTKANKEEYSKILEKETGVEAKIWLGTLVAEIPDITWVNDETIKAQQEVADIFFDLQLIPEKLDIKAAAWDGSKVSSD